MAVELSLWVAFGMAVGMLLGGMCGAQLETYWSQRELRNWEAAHHTTVITVPYRMTKLNGLNVAKKIYKVTTKQLDLVLHTLGGEVAGASAIAEAIMEYSGTVKTWIPEYAQSGGALVAVVASAKGPLVMARGAKLTPFDPLYGNETSQAVLNHMADMERTNPRNVMNSSEVHAVVLLKRVHTMLHDMATSAMQPAYTAEAIKTLLGHFMNYTEYTHHYHFFTRKQLIAWGLRVDPSTTIPSAIQSFADA